MKWQINCKKIRQFSPCFPRATVTSGVVLSLTIKFRCLTVKDEDRKPFYLSLIFTSLDIRFYLNRRPADSFCLVSYITRIFSLQDDTIFRNMFYLLDFTFSSDSKKFFLEIFSAHRCTFNG